MLRQHEHAAVDAVIAARRAVLLLKIRFTLLLAFVASNDGRAQHFWPFWPITIKPCLRFPGKSGKIREGPDLRRKYLTSSLLENVVLMAGFFYGWITSELLQQRPWLLFSSSSFGSVTEVPIPRPRFRVQTLFIHCNKGSRSSFFLWLNNSSQRVGLLF